MSPSADKDAQIAVLFSDLHQLMQPPLSPVPAPAATMSFPVEAPAPTPIYSNVFSRLVLASFPPAPISPRAGPLLSFSSSTVVPIDLALMPGPEEPAPILPVLPSPTPPSTVLTLSSSVNGAFLDFSSNFLVFLIVLFIGAPVAITTPAPTPISASSALSPVELLAIKSPKSRQCPIAMQADVSPPYSSRPKPRPRPVPRHPLLSSDSVSPPRSSVAAPSEAAESGAAFDSTILPPSSKLKPKPCKFRVPSKVPIPSPSRVSSPLRKRRHVRESGSSSKSKGRVRISPSRPSSQSKSFLFTLVSF